MTQLIARFSVSGWDEQDVSAVGTGWLDAGRMSKKFHSGLIGESTVLFISSGDEGRRAYLAAERITARTDDGQEGSVTIHHGGVESAPDAAFGHVVAGSGTGAFSEWAGSARIHHDDQGAYVLFDV